MRPPPHTAIPELHPHQQHPEHAASVGVRPPPRAVACKARGGSARRYQQVRVCQHRVRICYMLCSQSHYILTVSHYIPPSIDGTPDQCCNNANSTRDLLGWVSQLGYRQDIRRLVMTRNTGTVGVVGLRTGQPGAERLSGWYVAYPQCCFSSCFTDCFCPSLSLAHFLTALPPLSQTTVTVSTVTSSCTCAPHRQVMFNAGAPRQVNLYLTQLALNTPLYVAIPYPLGTTFSVQRSFRWENCLNRQLTPAPNMTYFMASAQGLRYFATTYDRLPCLRRGCALSSVLLGFLIGVVPMFCYAHCFSFLTFSSQYKRLRVALPQADRPRQRMEQPHRDAALSRHVCRPNPLEGPAVQHHCHHPQLHRHVLHHAHRGTCLISLLCGIAARMAKPSSSMSHNQSLMCRRRQGFGKTGA